MLRWLCFILLFALTGCGISVYSDTARTTASEKGKKLAATSLENAEWWMCRAASVGAIKDRYGVNTQKSIAYHIICQGDTEVNLIFPSGTQWMAAP